MSRQRTGDLLKQRRRLRRQFSKHFRSPMSLWWAGVGGGLAVLGVLPSWCPGVPTHALCFPPPLTRPEGLWMLAVQQDTVAKNVHSTKR